MSLGTQDGITARERHPSPPCRCELSLPAFVEFFIRSDDLNLCLEKVEKFAQSQLRQWGILRAQAKAGDLFITQPRQQEGGGQGEGGIRNVKAY